MPRTSAILSKMAVAALLIVPWLLSCQTAHTRYHLGRANQLYKAEKYEAAVEEYQKILDIDPRSWDANYRIAMSYLAIYHPGSTHPKDREASEQALAALERCMRLRAPDAETAARVRRYYPDLLVAAGKTDQAIEFDESLLKDDPRNAGLVVQLTSLYGKKGDFTNTLKYAEKRAELEPQNREAWYMVGVVCWERSYRGGALVSNDERRIVVPKGMDALQKALAIDPGYFEALSYASLLYREHGKMLQAFGDHEGADESFAKADQTLKKALEARKKTPVETKRS